MWRIVGWKAVMILLIQQWSSTALECPALYQRYSQRHTFCQAKNQQCHIKKEGVSKDEQRTILKLHNKIRNNIALGKDPSGKLPPAGDMLEMEWDEELSKVAQKLADQCLFKHDCNECRKVENFDVGQNLYKATIINSDPPSAHWEDAISSWYSEVHRFTPASINPFINDGSTGHFTQMAWSSTWRVGCGYVSFEKRKENWMQIYVCNYGPAGNVEDSEMYTVERPCSKCPGNTCCGTHCKKSHSVSYLGLCKVLEERGPDMDEGDFSRYLFNCDFKTESSSDCQSQIEGANKWQTRQIVSGVYKTVTLNGGDTTSLKFSSSIQSKDGFCLTLSFRKGANVAGSKSNNQFEVQLERKGATKPLNFKLDSEGNEWLPYSIGIPMKQPMQLGRLLYVFVHLVEKCCHNSDLADCRKTIITQGVSNLLNKTEESLDLLDPYQKNGHRLIWETATKSEYKCTTALHKNGSHILLDALYDVEGFDNK